MLREVPRRVACILEKFFDQANATHIPALLFSLLKARRVQPGGPIGLGGRQAARDVVLDESFQVIRKLVVQLPIDALSREHGSRPQAQHMEQAVDAHVRPPAA